MSLMNRVQRDEAKLLASRWTLPKGKIPQFLRRYFAALDTPVALSCWLLYEAGEWEQLLEKTISPEQYVDAVRFYRDYASISLLKKVDQSWNTGLDTRAAALKKFHAAESSCRETNRKFSSSGTLSPTVSAAIPAVARFLDEILGGFDAREWIAKMRFGPGADTSHRGFHSTLERKLTGKFGCTKTFEPYASRLLEDVAGFKRSSLYHTFVKGHDILEVSEGNVIITVPKNARTDRTIAIEPHLNVYAQLGLGAMMRRRLSRRGLNLDDQRPNQVLARVGSLNGSLATVDFSAASDTISRGVVEALFDHSFRGGVDGERSQRLLTWLHAMRICRSPYGTLDGARIRYEKWSSMGNGYTFELETLIFYSLARYACEVTGCTPDEKRCVNVYGDDVIIPTRAYDFYSSLCAEFGFTVNLDKSYSHGPFRESCGQDWFKGVLVRPFFLKEIINDISSCYRAINSLLHGAEQLGISELGSVRNWLIKQLPKPLALEVPPVVTGGTFSFRGRRMFIPKRIDISTSGITSSIGPFVKRFGWAGYFYNCVIDKPSKRRISSFDVGKEYILYLSRDGGSETATYGFVPSRSMSELQVVEAYTPVWCNTLLME